MIGTLLILKLIPDRCRKYISLPRPRIANMLLEKLVNEGVVATEGERVKWFAYSGIYVTWKTTI